MEGLYFGLASLRAERLRVKSQSETFRHVVLTISGRVFLRGMKALLLFHAIPKFSSTSLEKCIQIMQA